MSWHTWMAATRLAPDRSRSLHAVSAPNAGRLHHRSRADKDFEQIVFVPAC